MANLDIFSNNELIESVKQALYNNRKNCEDFFKQIVTKIENLCQKYEIPLLISRKANR